MKDTRPWTCPCCGGLNHPDIAFCPCGDSHRDEKSVDWKPARDEDGPAAAIVLVMAGVIGVLSLAYFLVNGF